MRPDRGPGRDDHRLQLELRRRVAGRGRREHRHHQPHIRRARALHVILTATNRRPDGHRTETVTVDNPPTTGSTSALSPAPLKSPPPLLTGHLTAPTHQKIAYVLKHGLRLTTSLNQSGTANFQITIPPRTSQHRNRPATHRRPNLKPAAISLLHLRSRTVAPGTHLITLKLFRRTLDARYPTIARSCSRSRSR